jgi:LuxR family maltose regulon positive regulatory protein
VTQVVETKLFAPAPRGGTIDRTRLSDRLDAVTHARLVLLSAPPGFGKSALLAQWLAEDTVRRSSVAWLSLDRADDDPGRFWTYLTAALGRVAPEAASATAMLAAGEPIPVVIDALLNVLHERDCDTVLVLDDYHVIESPVIHEALSSLIERLPPRARIVLATRVDPPLQLARLRARGELIELRARDLRFTQAEAAAYLNDTMGLGLSSGDVGALAERTEGWIAALQLAALSMQGLDDASAFIASYAGDDRFVVDYLVEEVLQRQPEHMRAFLLRTSILERLTGALCDTVTGQTDGRATLEALDRGNLFLVPLDQGRHWYRYHHLFGDMLRARLLHEDPDVVLDLHRRASAWLQGQGLRDEAIEHALAGEGWGRAAHLIELAIPDIRQARQDATLRRLLGALPRDVFRDRPVLAIGYVGALMSNGEPQDIEVLLADAERWLDPATRPGTGMVVADEAELQRLPSAIAMYRAAQARILGDHEGTVRHARHALELALVDDPLSRGGAEGFLALAYWTAGDLEIAHGFWADAMASLTRAGHTVDAVAIVRALAEIRTAQGRARDARRAYERGLALASEEGAAPLRGAADIHTGLAELALERNELDAAADHLLTSERLDARGGGLPQNAARRRVVEGLLREAEGDPDAAIGLLDAAERAHVGEYFPVVRPIAALRARILVAHGRLAEATDWATERGLSVDDQLDYVHEFEHVTYARVLMATSTAGDPGPMRRAAAFLERLLDAAEAGGRGRSVLELLVLLAMARDALRDEVGALAALRRALELGEPEGQTRVFLAEGAPMTKVLGSAIARGISPRFARAVLAAGGRAPRQPLAEPLSERELEVLRLLASDLDGPAIARELVVGLSTVRSHTKRIYAKLDVNDRRAAVRRAGELGLLAARHRPAD